MEKYAFVKEVGCGSFGKVFLVKSKQQGISYVVKQVDLSKLNKKQSQSASQEIKVLAKLKHRNIVSYKEYYEKNNQINIVLEYCENGDLYNKIKEKKLNNEYFNETEIWNFFIQICLGLEYIHDQNILHRDLKTKNIFLTKGNVIKLGDFGVAKILESSFELAETCIGSLFYVSPEICENKPYNKKTDIWALGCVLYEIAALKYAFSANNVKLLITKILSGSYNSLPTNLNMKFRSLIEEMLKPNPKERPTVKEVLEKRFLIKRKEKFVSSAVKSDFCRKSKSAVSVRNAKSVISNNFLTNYNVRSNKLSANCVETDHAKANKKINILSSPETKYKPVNINKETRFIRKYCNERQGKNENDSLNIFNIENKQSEEPNNFSSQNKNFKIDKESLYIKRNEIHNKKSNFEGLKNIKLPKVDSEYYKLIADGKKYLDNRKECSDEEIGKKVSDSKFKVDQKSVDKSEYEHTFKQVTEDVEKCKNNLKEETQYRRKWIKNTLQREKLLAILNDTNFLENCFPFTETHNLTEKLERKVSVDEMLSFEPSEISDDVLLPLKIKEDTLTENKNNFIQLIQEQIKNLNKQFALNDRNYPVEELVTLTNNSKKILEMCVFEQSLAENEKKISDSAFYNLEYQKMTLEQKLGFYPFLKVYRKIISIINNDHEGNFENSLEFPIEGTKTYVISKLTPSGDNGNTIKNTWNSIINILGEKQEYLPEIWQLAMFDIIYYYL